jgi:hypothetical protein
MASTCARTIPRSGLEREGRASHVFEESVIGQHRKLIERHQALRLARMNRVGPKKPASRVCSAGKRALQKHLRMSCSRVCIALLTTLPQPPREKVEFLQMDKHSKLGLGPLPSTRSARHRILPHRDHTLRGSRAELRSPSVLGGWGHDTLHARSRRRASELERTPFATDHGRTKQDCPKQAKVNLNQTGRIRILSANC